MAGCAVKVQRRYSAPGPCRKRNLQRVVVRGQVVTACLAHAVQLAGGGRVTLTPKARR